MEFLIDNNMVWIIIGVGVLLLYIISFLIKKRRVQICTVQLGTKKTLELTRVNKTQNNYHDLFFARSSHSMRWAFWKLYLYIRMKSKRVTLI